MNEKYQTVYEGLLRDTRYILGTSLRETEKTETCFHICLEYWEQVKNIFMRDPSRDEGEEIQFFKYCKPLFTGQLEYYALVYQFLLFCPLFDPAARRQFLEKELGKIERFREAYREFLDYYNRGDQVQDANFFLTRNYEGENLPYSRVFDLDENVSAHADWILTKWVGYGLYEEYLRILRV